MAQQATIDKTLLRPTGRPLQKISWKDKMKDKQQWFKDNCNYLMGISLFYAGGSTATLRGNRDLKMLYDVYNNKFPANWFTHFTNPLSAEDPKHLNFPAKIRPVGILRSNIDFLLAEFNNRPSQYQVQNLGEDGYIEYTEQLNKQINNNLMQHFYQEFLAQMQAAGQDISSAPPPEDIPLPSQVETEFQASYKDKKAIKAQKWLNRAKREYELKRMWLKMFKDWLIAGEAYSYRGYTDGKFYYRRVSPLNIDYDRSPDEDFVEDGEWCVERQLLLLSDVVDMYYDKLTDQNIDYLETKGPWYSPSNMFDQLASIYQNQQIPVYHVEWKGLTKYIHIQGIDPTTGQAYEDWVDEDYKLAPWEKKIKHVWVTETYKTTRIAEDIYVDMEAVKCQRNSMAGFSGCKLSYNGRKFSDTHSGNISVLELGIPFQILYIIVNYVKEKTLARSKGKIMFMDVNAIPRGNGWNQEKFFYYIEAMGFGLLNRHQQGVDRSWNQFSVQDMSLFDQIDQLIGLENAIKSQWDETLGITRQRKGETYASDLQGVNERAVFQSSLMTDMIFIPFEELLEREMQSLMDYGKYITSQGFYGLYNEDLLTSEMLRIEPEDFTNASFGVFATRSKELQDTLDALKAQVQAMLQNGMKPSTMIDIFTVTSLPELKALMLKTEALQEKQQQAQQEAEAQQEQQLEQMRQEAMQQQLETQLAIIQAKGDQDNRNIWAKAEAEAAYESLKEPEPQEEEDYITLNEQEKNNISREKIASSERMQQTQIAAQARQAALDRASKEKIAASKPKPKAK